MRARFVILSLVAAPALIVGCGSGSPSEVEHLVRQRYGVEVSCKSDHHITLGQGNATVYACSSTGSSGEQLCVVMEDGHLVEARRLSEVGITKLFCHGQG